MESEKVPPRVSASVQSAVKDEEVERRLTNSGDKQQTFLDPSRATDISFDDQSRDYNQSPISKKPTLSDLTSELNFIDDDDATASDYEVRQRAVLRKETSSASKTPSIPDRVADETQRHSNGIRERITVPPDQLPLTQLKSVGNLDTPLGDSYLTVEQLSKSRSLPGYQSKSDKARPGPYDGCRAGGFFVKSALGNKTDCDVLLPRMGRLDSKEEQGASDSDAGEIVPSPTSSSRDSLDERPNLRPTYAPDPKSISGHFLGSSKGAFTSMSFPQLPQVNLDDTPNIPYSKTLSESFRIKKTREAHLSVRSISTASSNTYTG